MMTNDEALLTIRRPGARLLVAVFWLNVPALWLAGRLTGSDAAMLVAGFGAALNVVPTLLVFRANRIDGATRLAIGITAVSFPALFVFLFQNHPWQMDLHMYFFAALAALTVLCDKKPIIVGSAAVALHHLILNFVAPGLIFAGSGDLPRVLLHAVIVVMQTAVLLWMTHRLSALVVDKANEVAASDTLRIEADTARNQAEAALQALEEAQRVAERQRNAEEAVREANEKAERRRLAADAIEARLGKIVQELGGMAEQLSTSKATLVSTLQATVARSDELRRSHARAETDVRTMAADTERLVASIHEVGRNATVTRETANEGARATSALPRKVEALAMTVDSANDMLKMISVIASQSNMLSLNATIEAARQGVEGQGFVVVAGEIKTLSHQTSQAAAQIAGHLNDIRAAAVGVSGAITVASDSVESIDNSAAKIARVVQDQIVATTELAAASEQVAQHIALAATEAEALAGSIVAVRDAMGDTSGIATAVSQRSQELNETVRNILAELRAA